MIKVHTIKSNITDLQFVCKTWWDLSVLLYRAAPYKANEPLAPWYQNAVESTVICNQCQQIMSRDCTA